MQRTMVAALLLAGLSGAAQAQARVPRWHERIETAAETARESGKPLLIVFRCVR